MKTKLLVLLLIIIIISPFLIYKFNKDLSKKYLEYYLNSKFSKLSNGSVVTFSDFKLESNDKFNELIIYDINIASKGSKIVVVDKLKFYFNWGFLYTKIKPIKAVIENAAINIPSTSSDNKEDKIEGLLAATQLLDTEILVENITFNEYVIKEVLVRINKKAKKGIINIRINEEDDSEVEIEIPQTNIEKIAIILNSFNPKKSVFHELIKNNLELNSINLDAVLDGFLIVNINKRNVQGIIDNISGTLNIQEDFPLNIQKGNFNFEAGDDRFTLYNANVNVDEFFFSGEIRYSFDDNPNSGLSESSGLSGLYINGRVDNISSDQILRFWSLDEKSDERDWYTRNIKSGLVKSAEIVIDQPNDYVTIKDLKFENFNGHIVEDDIVLDVSNADGSLELINEELKVDIKSAHLYNTKVNNAHIEVSYTNNDTKININANVSDNIKNLLLISKNIISNQINAINNVINLDNATNGSVDVSVNLEIYTSNSTVHPQIYASFQGLHLPNIFNAFEIQDSDLRLEVDDEKIQLFGTLLLNGKVIGLSAENDYGHFTHINLNGDFNVDNFKKADFLPDSQFISGEFPGKFKIIANENSDFTVRGTGKLNGILDKAIKIFGLEKNNDAKFTFDINKKDDEYNLENLQISGKNIDIHGKGKITQNNTNITFDKINIANSKAVLNYGLQDNIQSINIDSKFLDLSEFGQIDLLFSNKKNHHKYNFNAKIDELRLKNNISLLKTEVQLNNIYGKLSGTFSDNSILSIGYDKPIGIDLNTTNAGTLLRALGLSDSIIGGRATVRLDTKDDIRHNKGNLRIENFSIRDAPTLAQILSLASLRGIIDTLNGGGIHFYRFLSSFTYGEGVIEFDESWIEGNALGIRAGGIISIPEEGAIIYGNVVPLYMLNKIIWKLPLIGKIITGGGNSRSLIAAEYTMNKTRKKTSVYVNPLAALTPNIIKNLLKIFNYT